MLITGSTSGIDYELAKIFASNGHNLILVARGENKFASTRPRIHRLVSCLLDLMNLDKTDQVEKLEDCCYV